METPPMLMVFTGKDGDFCMAMFVYQTGVIVEWFGATLLTVNGRHQVTTWDFSKWFMILSINSHLEYLVCVEPPQKGSCFFDPVETSKPPISPLEKNLAWDFSVLEKQPYQVLSGVSSINSMNCEIILNNSSLNRRFLEINTCYWF